MTLPASTLTAPEEMRTDKIFPWLWFATMTLFEMPTARPYGAFKPVASVVTADELTTMAYSVPSSRDVT